MIFGGTPFGSQTVIGNTNANIKCLCRQKKKKSVFRSHSPAHTVAADMTVPLSVLQFRPEYSLEPRAAVHLPSFAQGSLFLFLVFL